ncbi:competence protein ComEA [Fontimonas thermophila]|uniref:Competence protein ComEA n=1 Tax=Fontimonas thermophila TaxID=1076937 RepID=A0A1I2KIJ6_9GAMM|nr:helix-hairpin-helix domain-containing protein [Fontimonas thermophila]SFF49400.1 competence protein ComEA [Fontimonas thermophila]SFF59252.1 competence protein ComEA [Fontimonas thermophila]SFF64776.1 competence protein ComEA [Fontimonas thermophila]SFF68645.1 competence protein ComEA [Fontimonas thermophila]
MNTWFKAVLVGAGLVVGVAHAGVVNINTADAKTLAKELKGVGPAKAEAIVKDRAERGLFKAPQEITRVEGIGPAIYEQNKDNIKVKD